MRWNYFAVSLVLLLLCQASYGLLVTSPNLHWRQRVPHHSRMSLSPNQLVDLESWRSCLADVNPDIGTYALSGAISGASRSAARFLSYPLDTLKTIAQAEPLDKDEREMQRMATKAAPRTAVDLFRGVVLAIVSAIPANSIFIVVYNSLDAYRTCVPPSFFPLAHLSLPLQHILYSAIATVPQNLFKIPAELLKQRAQLSDSSFSLGGSESPSGGVSFSSVLADAQRLGLRGLYQGGGAMMLREVPFNAIQMASFYSLNEYLPEDLLTADPTARSGLLGLLAAGVAALATQPADTIKTRLMKADSKGETVKSMATKIWKANGVRGLYVGLWSRLLLVSIGGLIYFATMELSGGQMPG